jgi:phosphoglycerate kinase
MAKICVTDYPVQGRRVFVRVDFNVPLDDGGVADDMRIKAALPTIQHLIDRGCSLVLASHLGRPKGQVVEQLRLDPVAQRLSDLLDREVQKVDDCVGPEVAEAAGQLKPGEVLLLENVRFHSEETANDPAFALRLAELADVFVNDAFGTAHRAHASTEGIAHRLPAVAGLLMKRELEVLGSLLADPGRPFVVVLGGAKVSDKIGVIEKMLTLADAVLVGGAMCFPLLKAQGVTVGTSRVEEGTEEIAAQALAAAAASACAFELPADLVVAAVAEAGAASQTVAADAIPADRMGLDIGRLTIASFADHLASAGTVFWNGPMGLFEIDDFAVGTRAVGEAIVASAATSVVGGGDTVSAVRHFGLEEHITHVSTGGGASMEFLEGKTLPGVAALLDAED